MNGMALNEIMQERRPGIPVLYISGYTSEVIVHNGTLADEVMFLKKPFSAEQMMERVRHLLAG
jgi:DNA-binding NtrC family response regulator